MKPATYEASQLPGGKPGTIATLQAMARLVRESAARPDVIEHAQSVVSRVRERDDIASMDALLRNVRGMMRYTRDPLETEFIRAPWVLLHRAAQFGTPQPMDCDDASTLLAALLVSVGIPAAFKVIAGDKGRPNEFSHVYVVAKTSSGAWIPLDPIMREYPVGAEAPKRAYFRSGVYGLNGQHSLNGLGCDCANGDRNMAGMGEDSDYKTTLQTTADVAKTYIQSRAPRARQNANRAMASVDPSMAPPPPSSLSQTLREWLVPYTEEGINWKAVAVYGVGAFLVWKSGILRSKGRRK